MDHQTEVNGLPGRYQIVQPVRPAKNDILEILRMNVFDECLFELVRNDNLVPSGWSILNFRVERILIVEIHQNTYWGDSSNSSLAIAAPVLHQ